MINSQKQINIKSTITLLVSVLTALAAYLYITRAQPVKIDSGNRMIMGTISRIVAIASDAESAQAGIDAAWFQQQHIDKLMSYQRKDSLLNRINELAWQRPVKIDPNTYRVIDEALKISSLSNGAFDISIGPIEDIWHKAAKTNKSPTDKELAHAKKLVGWKKIILNKKNSTISLAVKGMRLDLGGIAKGYAIDKSIEALKKHGVICAMVDIGGDIRCYNQKKLHKLWKIGLQNPKVNDPNSAYNPILLTLALKNQAVATSGDYRRFVLVNGK